MDQRIDNIERRLQHIEQGAAVTTSQLSTLIESVNSIKDILDNKLVSVTVCKMQSRMLQSAVDEVAVGVSTLRKELDEHREQHAGTMRKILMGMLTGVISTIIVFVVTQVLSNSSRMVSKFEPETQSRVKQVRGK